VPFPQLLGHSSNHVGVVGGLLRVRGAALRALFLSTVMLLGAAACGGGSSATITQEAARGRVLYEQTCSSCHGNAATGAGATPTAANHGPAGHTWHHADGQLIDIIMGRLDYPGRIMPSFGEVLSEEDAKVIVEYFKINWRPEQRASQKEVSKNWDEMMKEGK